MSGAEVVIEWAKAAGAVCIAAGLGVLLVGFAFALYRDLSDYD